MTPRTDAIDNRVSELRDHAEQLERELAVAMATLKTLTNAAPQASPSVAPAVDAGPAVAAHVKGRLIEMGELKSADLDGTVHTYPMALLITFDSREAIKQAVNDGICRFEFK
jgi:hypothetical protein